MMNRMVTAAALRGSELSSLYPRHTKDWWAIVEDVFGSPAVPHPWKSTRWSVTLT